MTDSHIQPTTRVGIQPEAVEEEFKSLLDSEAAQLGSVMLTSDQIKWKVRELGRRISQDYCCRKPVLVGVLKGMLCFMADLIREIALPLEVDVMIVSRRGENDQHSARIIKDLESDISGRDVILVEDILDSGLTLDYLTRHLTAKRPATLEVCVLLDKKPRRVLDVPVRYAGFEVGDEFVIGYGLDYQEKYRNLPFIASLILP